MRAWSKSNDEQSCSRVAEGRNRFGPIIPVEIGAALLIADAVAVFPQAGTEVAARDLRLEHLERMTSGQQAYFINSRRMLSRESAMPGASGAGFIRR